MDDQDILAAFERHNAYLKGLHVVYASGKHGEEYLNKDALLPYVMDVSLLCEELAHRIVAAGVNIGVVVVPVVGAVALGQWMAYHLTLKTRKDVVTVYADKVTEEALLRKDRQQLMEIGKRLAEYKRWTDAEEIKRFIAAIEARPNSVETFELKRGYDALVNGCDCLVMEDVINTGGSITKVIEVTRKAGGRVVAAGGLANRGSVTAEALSVSRLLTLLDINMGAWPEDELPEHIKQRLIATHVGHGKKYLEGRDLRSSKT